MRVSEVVRVQWRDFDFDRNTIFIRKAKGNADRYVQLPQSYQALLQGLKPDQPGDAHVFLSECQNTTRAAQRHLSTRTVQRVLKNACQVAGIAKSATPHSLRHAFATHSFEDGCDIRRIQTVLGHARLDTTTIYVQVAEKRTAMSSPLDRLAHEPSSGNPVTPATQQTHSGQAMPPQHEASPVAPPVGRLVIHSRQDPDPQSDAMQFTLEVRGGSERVFLTGIRAREVRPGWVTMTLPPSEAWEVPLSRLSVAQSERIRAPEFYVMLQREITSRVVSRNEPSAHHR